MKKNPKKPQKRKIVELDGITSQKKPKNEGKIKGGTSILNQIPIPMIESRISSNIPDEKEICVLRERYETNGYLLVKNFLVREEVIAARRAILESCKESGFIDDSKEVSFHFYLSSSFIISFLRS